MIRPRYKGERGGTLTTCPRCGQQCWESKLTRECLKKDKTLKALCTECALGGK